MAGDRMRDEAERLVAAAIAAVSYATRGLGAASRPGATFANGSPECCVCPVCRAIAAMRDPAPELADKLAAGVGDLASGLSSILRTLSQRGGSSAPVEEPVTAEGDEFWESLRRKAADAAKAAARATSTMDAGRGSTVDDDPWRIATSSVPSAPGASSATNASSATDASPAAAPKPIAKKAVAKKAAPPAKKVAAPRVGATDNPAPRKATRPRPEGAA